MSNMKAYKIQPRGPFYFGERGVGLEETGDFLHSDTLFSAIASAWSRLGPGMSDLDPANGNDLKILERFRQGNPPFRISSAFPFAGDVLFFPRPLVELGGSKDARKVRFISEGAWRLFCAGREPSERDLIQGKAAWVTATEREAIIAMLTNDLPPDEAEAQRKKFAASPSRIRIWSGQSSPPVPHVSIDRLASLANLHHQARLQFIPDGGLYFWVEMNDPTFSDFFEAALRFLEDEGLGGRRSSGHGQFRMIPIDRELPEVSGANLQVTLSLFRPGEAKVTEGLLDEGRYELVTRRGWITSGDGMAFRRRSLAMLTEGSVFHLTTPLDGTFENVRPTPPGKPADQTDPTAPEDDDGNRVTHPVWRYGYALTMPLRWETWT